MQILSESYRFFRKHIGYSLINLGGLSLGLAVFLLLHLFIQQQKNYDTFWQDHERISRIETTWTEEDERVRYATAPPPLAPYLMEYAEIEAATRLVNWSHFTMRPDNDSSKVFRETNVYIADKQFFHVFTGLLVAGDDTAFDEPGSVVLSETAMRKYFGDVRPESMIGRLILGGKDAGTPWKITGIYRDIPETSHMNFEIMVSMWDEFSENDIWTWNVMHTYIRTRPGSGNVQAILDKAAAEKAIPYLVQQGAVTTRPDTDNFYFSQTPVEEVHLQTGLRDAMEPGIRPDYLDILSGVSLLVIFLACFNFMNISTALSYSRIRNVGIMKIHGASFASLFIRYMGEYLLQILVALAVGVGIIELILLYVNELYGMHLQVTGLLSPQMIMLTAWLVILSAVLSGLYPTWRLLRGKSTILLKGETGSGKSFLRNALITGQFAISLFLIACTITLHNQLKFMEEIEPGFDRENMLVIQNDREIEEERDAFTAALRQVPGVVSASFTTGLPAQSRYQLRDIKVLGSSVQAPVTWYETDEHFVETMGIRMVEGSGFVRGRSDQALLNQEAVKLLNLAQPVGARLVVNEGAADEHSVTITGVVENFHQRDFRQETEPLIMEYLDNFIFRDFVAIRYSENAADVLDEARLVWSTFEPDVPMNYFFFDNSFNQLFKSESLLNQLLTVFSVLALVIALIGLLGVVAITSQQRMKEIGIRKVLGASSAGIIRLMVRQFSILVFIACLISLPLSWLVSGAWLNDFVFRTELHVTGFLLTGVAVFVLSVIIVAALAWKSSRMNPVSVIRKDS